MALFEKSKRSGKSKREPSRRRTGVPQFDPAHFFETSTKGRSISTHRKNEIIFSQGDAADAVFYIKKGKIKVTVVSKQGKEAVVALLGADEFLGEGCLIGQPRRVAAAVTMSECTVMRVGKAEIQRLLQDDPAFSQMFMSHILARKIALRKTWWTNSSTRRKSGSRDYCYCWRTLARKGVQSRLSRRSARKYSLR